MQLWCSCHVYEYCIGAFFTLYQVYCVPHRAEIDLASVEVRFENLSIDADIAVGARGEPTVLNAYRNKLEVCYQNI